MKFRPSPEDGASLPADADFQVTVAAELTDAEPGADIVVSDAPPADNRPIEGLPTIGHIGRYALKHRLGEGGLGTVYAAFDPLLSRGIALKTLHVEVQAADREAFEAMLLHEARAAAALSHPNIVTVYDAGLAEDGVYLAMEHLRGRDLRHLLADGWRPQVRQAVQIVRRVAEALAYAHHKGVIHCDIKPANIFMVSRTGPKVLDFGIARVAQRPDAGATQALAAGSPYYMAPEQLRGDPLDRRCDVYSLGVVLYELLTGQRAYAGTTLDEIGEAVRYRMPTPVHEINREVSATLSGIVRRATAKDPADRPRSARLLARELRDWLDEQAPSRHSELPPLRRRWPLVAAAAAALAVGAAAWGLSTRAAPEVDAAPAIVEPSALPMPLAVATPAADATSAAAPSTVVAAAPNPSPAPRPAAKQRAAPRDPSAVPAVAPAPARGTVQIAVSPWGNVEVDGAPAGTTPPLTRLQLPEGRHTIVIQNADFPSFSTTVTVSADQPVTIKHRFGQ